MAPGSGGDFQATGNSDVDIVGLVLALLGAVWSLLVWPVMRFAALLPFAVLRGRRSRAVRIEAINPFPRREVYLWTTTDLLLDDVLDEIAAGLRDGKVVQPSGAVFSGRTSS